MGKTRHKVYPLSIRGFIAHPSGRRVTGLRFVEQPSGRRFLLSPTRLCAGLYGCRGDFPAGKTRVTAGGAAAVLFSGGRFISAFASASHDA